MKLSDRIALALVRGNSHYTAEEIWERLLSALDADGYQIVQKPLLLTERADG